MQILLNEVLYDPAGADGGYEFVELAAAPGAAADASLAGWRLETGNGSTGEWRVAWTGAAGDRLAAGLFVIGESAVDPRPDVVTDLDLQNGPDACRLVSPQGEIDVLGWGAPLPDPFFEGAAAADVSGDSLARLPDGVDTNDNTLDFRAASPSPGDFNAPASLVLVEDVQLPSAGLPAGDAWTFRATLRNAGRDAWWGEAGVGCVLHPEETLARFVVEEAEALTPGARMERAFVAWPPPGVHLPRAEPSGPTADAPWFGEGQDLIVSEAMSHPEPDDPEWVELENVGRQPVDLGTLELRDAAGAGGSLRGALDPGAFAVVVRDTSGFVARWGRPGGVVLVALSGFPALNHTGPPQDVAERVELRWSRDLRAAGNAEPLDIGALPGGAASGVSWERVSLALPGNRPESWAPSLDSRGGTPGRANSRPADRPVDLGTAALVAEPRTFRPGRDGGALFVLRTRKGAARGELTVHDSAGRQVVSLLPWSSGDTEQRAVWDGRETGGDPAPPGLYVVCARGAGIGAARTTVVLAP